MPVNPITDLSVTVPEGLQALVAMWNALGGAPRLPRSDIGVKRQPRTFRYGRCCGQCDADFAPTRWDANYCSGACRQRAYRKRKARLN